MKWREELDLINAFLAAIIVFLGVLIGVKLIIRAVVWLLQGS